MADSRRKEIELRLRRSRGRRLVSEWSRRLCAAAAVDVSEVSFLSVDDTAELKKGFLSALKSASDANKSYWKRESQDDVAQQLRSAVAALQVSNVVLFSSVDSLIGAVRIPAEHVLCHAFAVWKVVEQDLCLTSDGLQDGLCLEESYYAPDGTFVKSGIIELTSWGVFRLGQSWEAT